MIATCSIHLNEKYINRMKRITPFLIVLLVGLLLSSCAGIKYLTVETREPAQVALPSDVLSVIVVNNVVEQPDDIGHDSKLLGRSDVQKEKGSSDSIAVYYTEALAQFLEEEDYFQRVLFLDEPLRDDKDFFREQPLTPEMMNEIRSKTGADAIISLDKLIMETRKQEFYRQQGYTYSAMTGKIHSILRVYLPTMEGKIPAVHYIDSIRWEGFDIPDKLAYADAMLPSREEGMKLLAVEAAEKMTYVFAPHWEMQDRWYYTLPGSLMREGEAFAKRAEWFSAIEKWETFYNSRSNKTNKAKAATNIALAYEMLDDMDKALEWAIIANDLFVQSTTQNSLERRRSLLYKNEIMRRNNTGNRLNMDDL
jgi:tetratricopeptide (TPR) repeat protein